MAASNLKAQPVIGTPLQAVTGKARLIRVIVQAIGAGLTHIYDNTASAGTPIFSLPASPVVGGVYELDIPCTTGLRIDVLVTGPQLTVIYAAD